MKSVEALLSIVYSVLKQCSARLNAIHGKNYFSMHNLNNKWVLKILTMDAYAITAVRCGIVRD